MAQDKHYINWREARGSKLSDHERGDLCRDAKGRLFLIGDVKEGTNHDGGCGCCASPVTSEVIVSYVPLLEYIGYPEDRV